jgi:hypothetical protein
LNKPRSERTLDIEPIHFKILMAIPRNLVYVFLLAIIFAFAGMIYVVYTEKDLSGFMNMSYRDSLVDSNIVVHPLFAYLR